MRATNPPAVYQPIVNPQGVVTNPWWTWFTDIGRLFQKGYTGTVDLAAITGGGSNGSLTIENGVITEYTPPT